MGALVLIALVLIILKIFSPGFSFSEMFLRVFERCVSIIAMVLMVYCILKFIF